MIKHVVPEFSRLKLNNLGWHNTTTRRRLGSAISWYTDGSLSAAVKCAPL